MGFELEEDHYRLFFEDQKLNGLEVTMSRLGSVGESMQFDKVRFRDVTTLDEIHTRLEDLVEIVGAHLVSWNLTKKGIPVPCNAKGLTDADDRILDAVIPAWVMAMREVPAPLALSSTDTESSSNDGSPPGAPLSIPMEPLSENP
jgi:hypothetical protein